MLFLPLEEDSLLFRLCLYYGAVVLLLELLVPLLFQRRVRIEIPRLALRAPAVPLSIREFQQRRLALQQQLAALQRALAETPRRSPQKRRQRSSASAAKQRPAASPSPLASPTSSVKVTRPKSLRKTSENKQKIDRKREQEEDGGGNRRKTEEEPLRQPPMAMSESLATRSRRRGGFSFDEVREEEKKEEKKEENQQEEENWTQVMNSRIPRRRESPKRRPVRLVEDVERIGYNGPSEAAARLEALIGARRRLKPTTSTSYAAPPPPGITARSHPPAPVPVSVPVAPTAGYEKPAEHSVPKRTPHEVPSPLGQQSESKTMEEDEETKESERSEPLTDFQAFCASFVVGGSAAALQAAAKRKHHEAFGSDDEQTNGGGIVAQQPEEKRKQPRLLGQDIEQPNDTTAAATPQSLDKRSHYEAFGSDDEKEIDNAVATQRVPEKRTHDQAFGTTEAQERPQEKTPRIVRRISFGDEVEAMAASPPKEVPVERSTGKRKHKQAFGMLDDDEEDVEWRDSLAFHPHRFG